jgi:hypothetical protein
MGAMHRQLILTINPRWSWALQGISNWLQYWRADHILGSSSLSRGNSNYKAPAAPKILLPTAPDPALRIYSSPGCTRYMGGERHSATLRVTASAAPVCNTPSKPRKVPSPESIGVPSLPSAGPPLIGEYPAPKERAVAHTKNQTLCCVMNMINSSCRMAVQLKSH